ncbi:MAG: glycosyltransferase family 4 protein, partial [Candidatus Micrarchaeota archaeon]|nr:glycosyltransferase family 4 protein [Candidatus Micrarchaeota archaeon]
LIKDPTKFEVYNRFVPDDVVPRLFKQAKVVVLPYTRHKGHSGVLNIARAFGRPVVVTSVGDLPNMVKDGENGLVVSPKDPVSLANAVIKILKDDRLRMEMGKKALEKAKELSWDNIAKMHMKIYEEVIKERGQ